MEQLQQALDAVHGDGDADVARKLSALELTERLSDTRLASLTAAIYGPKTRQALTTLAEASTFLQPPQADIPADAPPDAKAQLRMISSAAEYLKQTISKLPNFFAPVATERTVLKCYPAITERSQLTRRAEQLFASKQRQTWKGSRPSSGPASWSHTARWRSEGRPSFAR